MAVLLPLSVVVVFSFPSTNAIQAQSTAPLWQSPGSGKTIGLQFVPDGAQWFLYAQPKTLLAGKQSQPAMRALGPRFASAVSSWSQETGVQLDSVESILLAVVPDTSGALKRVSVVHLADDQPALTPHSPQPSGDSNSGSEFRFVAEPRVMVFGPESMLKVIHESSRAGFLNRPMNAIRLATDESHHMTMFFAPSFLLREAKNWFQGDLAALQEPLEMLLSEETQAASVCLHFDGEEVFAELRFQMTLERRRSLRKSFFDLAKQTIQLADDRRKRLRPLDPYWEQLSDRLPPMIDVVVEQTRFAWERNQAVLNVSLPSKAAHNLLLAGELLLAEDDSTPGSSQPKTTLTLIDTLKIRFDYTFSQRSFDNAFRGLSREFGVSHPDADLRIEIAGEVLKKAGVTRNQELSNFRPGEKTVGQLLTLLAMRANPSQVASPSSDGQIIVWTVRTDSDDPDRQVVLITTRQSAEENGLPIPKYFRKK